MVRVCACSSTVVVVVGVVVAVEGDAEGKHEEKEDDLLSFRGLLMAIGILVVLLLRRGGGSAGFCVDCCLKSKALLAFCSGAGQVDDPTLSAQEQQEEEEEEEQEQEEAIAAPLLQLKEKSFCGEGKLVGSGDFMNPPPAKRCCLVSGLAVDKGDEEDIGMAAVVVIIIIRFLCLWRW